MRALRQRRTQRRRRPMRPARRATHPPRASSRDWVALPRAWTVGFRFGGVKELHLKTSLRGAAAAARDTLSLFAGVCVRAQTLQSREGATGGRRLDLAPGRVAACAGSLARQSRRAHALAPARPGLF